jgi:hypothetical protein
MSGSSPVRELTRNRKVEVALHNETITRQRVDRLENGLSAVAKTTTDQIGQLQALWPIVMERGLWGRLRWLFTGR